MFLRYFRLLFLFLVVIAAGFGGIWLLKNNTPLQLVWLGYEIRTSVAFLVLALFAISVVFVFATVAVLWVVRLPSRTKNALQHRRHDSGLQLLTQGMIAYAAGQPEEALRLAHKAAEKLPQQKTLPSLVAAEIARASGDSAEMRKHYGALLQYPETEFVALKGLMLQSQKDKDYAEMLSLGTKAKQLRPKDVALSALLFHANKQQRRWVEAEQELDQLVKYARKDTHAKALAMLGGSAPQGSELSRQKGLLLFQRAREAYGKYDVKLALQLVLQALDYVPDLPPLLVLAAQIAPEAKAPRRVRTLLEETWKSAPHPDITRAFLLLYAAEAPEKRLKYAEKLAESHPEWVESHRLIALCALEARDFVKARNHVKAALAREETASLCLLMAQIAREEREFEQAEQWQKRALLAIPDHVWVCQSCGFHAQQWDVFCGSCNTWDSYHYEQPHAYARGRDTLLLTNVV